MRFSSARTRHDSHEAEGECSSEVHRRIETRSRPSLCSEEKPQEEERMAWGPTHSFVDAHTTWAASWSEMGRASVACENR